MKLIKTLIAACLVTALTSVAGELSEADKKWSEAVEKMIATGSATITTPQESRVKLAKELAAKLGRECKVEKIEKSYRVVVSGAKADGQNITKAGN